MYRPQGGHAGGALGAGGCDYRCPEGCEIVRLGDLDTLQIGISSKGAVTEEEYDASLIKKARINFRPGLALAGTSRD